ncbi:MAG: FtsH protease activity modulator HflK [Candidatus Hinthialibacter antarcticus]|nr:FtsH protease activity modulator HflK [Candidatus Hinthialibacter antarcticus]
MDKNFQDWFEELPLEEQKRRKEQMANMQPPAWIKKWVPTVIILSIVFFGLLVFRPWVTIDTDEIGVVLRLGEFSRTLGPGIHFRLPPPVELIYTPQVTQVKRIEIGFRSRPGTTPAQQVSGESYMLTGDENIAEVKIAVQFLINDPVKYLFNADDVEETVKDIAESAMRKVVGDYPIDAVLTDRREDIAAEIKLEIQALCENYNLGVSIKQVQLQGVDVPPEVQPAFRQVVSARENQVRFVNEAEGYRNSEVPKAEGKVQELLQEAQAYRVKRIAESQGVVERFAAVLREYEAAPEVTKTRLYLETMEKVLEGKTKVIIGTQSQNDVLKFLNVTPSGLTPTLPIAPDPQGGR